jgi:hypothetical protein
VQNLNPILLVYIRIIDQCPVLVHTLQYKDRRGRDRTEVVSSNASHVYSIQHYVI